MKGTRYTTDDTTLILQSRGRNVLTMGFAISRTPRRVWAVLLSGLLLSSHAAFADILLDNVSAGVWVFANVEYNPWAQQFTMPNNGTSYQMTALTLPFMTPVWGQGPAEVSLWSSSENGLPELDLGSIGIQLVVNEGDLTFVPATPLILSPGESYFILFDAPGANWTFSLTPAGTINTGLADFGTLLEYVLGPMAGTPFGGYDANIRLVATPVPEPSTLALVGLCAAALMMFRRRK